MSTDRTLTPIIDAVLAAGMNPQPELIRIARDLERRNAVLGEELRLALAYIDQMEKALLENGGRL